MTVGRDRAQERVGADSIALEKKTRFIVGHYIRHEGGGGGGGDKTHRNLVLSGKIIKNKVPILPTVRKYRGIQGGQPLNKKTGEEVALLHY